jgi:hypothetical protein
MKEIQQHDKDKIKIVKQAEVKKQQQFIGKVRLAKGLTLYQMNCKTGNISKVQYDDAVVKIENVKANKTKRVLKVKYLPGHLYVQALNDKNAKRKFTKIALELIQQHK